MQIVAQYDAAADHDLDPSTMSGKNQHKEIPVRVLTISEPNWSSLRLMSCPTYSLGNLFAIG